MSKFSNRVLYGRGLNIAGISHSTQLSYIPIAITSPISHPSMPSQAYLSKKLDVATFSPTIFSVIRTTRR